MASTTNDELAATLVEDARQVWPREFDSIEKAFNDCCFAIAFSVIRELDLFAGKGDFETFDSLREKVGLFRDAEYVMRHVLDILRDEGVLAERDGGWICLDPEPYIETPAESIVSATRAFPEEGASFQWLARAADGLVPFLRGKLYAEEVMFPMGSFKLVEEVYNTSNVYGFYSRLAGKAVKRFAEQRFSDPITMMEVGAGTGNGTANVLAETDDRFARYVFTDVSKSLVQMGRRRFKKRGYDFIEYATYDACVDVGQQGFAADSMDLVLAVNVLHATNDVIGALRGIRQMLRPDGTLILSEIAPPAGGIYRYMELTFGLLPSYSVYEDRELRPRSPIIRPEEWIDAMVQAGFRRVTAIPGAASPEMDRGGIVVGEK